MAFGAATSTVTVGLANDSLPLLAHRLAPQRNANRPRREVSATLGALQGGAIPEGCEVLCFLPTGSIPFDKTKLSSAQLNKGCGCSALGEAQRSPPPSSLVKRMAKTYVMMIRNSRTKNTASHGSGADFVPKSLENCANLPPRRCLRWQRKVGPG